jgi:argininosuccinate lyase
MMLWGGRFTESPDEAAARFSSSLGFDVALLPYDCRGGRAHARMLAKIGVIERAEADRLVEGLDQIEKEHAEGAWSPDPAEFEDVHSAVEARLFEIVGETAGKLHSGRSRNDQVATDVRLRARDMCDEILDALADWRRALVEKAEEHVETVMPGYTHLQRAQPISLGFHFLAYAEMAKRDAARFEFVKTEANVSPLGCGALAGSTLPLDRQAVADELGFDDLARNALDAVSDRDYLVDFLNAAALVLVHLSRHAEEIVLWATTEWRFAKIGDRYATGSSLMPQKKNPDMAELVRGKAGRVLGSWVALTTTLKGLPLAYNRDLQEDKEPVFDAARTTLDALRITTAALRSTDFDRERFLGEMTGDFSLATDLADWLVLRGVPFREAHGVVGLVVKRAEETGKRLDELTLDEMRAIDERFDESAREVFRIEDALERKRTIGSPNPDLTREEIARHKRELG